MGRVSIKFLIAFKTKGTIPLQLSNEIKVFTVCNQKYLKEMMRHELADFLLENRR